MLLKFGFSPDLGPKFAAHSGKDADTTLKIYPRLVLSKGLCTSLRTMGRSGTAGKGQFQQ